MKELKLGTPLLVNGVEVTSLPYDFESMTVEDKLRVGQYMAGRGLLIRGAEELDTSYHLMLFAFAVEKASKNEIGVEDVLRMSARDAVEGGKAARSFFYFSDRDGEAG